VIGRVAVGFFPVQSGSVKRVVASSKRRLEIGPKPSLTKRQSRSRRYAWRAEKVGDDLETADRDGTCTEGIRVIALDRPARALSAVCKSRKKCS
jgi:hypothetical protein